MPSPFSPATVTGPMAGACSGRDPASIDVAFTTGQPGPADDGFNAGAHLDGIEAMAALGVTWNSVGMPGDSLDHAIECLEQYGSEVISQQT